MSGYTPQVGDRVRLGSWLDGVYVTVVATGRYMFLAEDQAGGESAGVLTGWLKVPEPVVYPELWVNIEASAYASAYRTREDADEYAHTGRIAVIHLAADGTLTLHPMERES
jgi:hypothetical protein